MIWKKTFFSKLKIENISQKVILMKKEKEKVLIERSKMTKKNKFPSFTKQ